MYNKPVIIKKINHFRVIQDPSPIIVDSLSLLFNQEKRIQMTYSDDFTIRSNKNDHINNDDNINEGLY